MDWLRVRKTLRELRIEKKMGVPELADEAGLAKSTLYRIEAVDEEPEKQLDLLTIEKLLVAMEVPLSTFFARVEGRPEMPAAEPEVDALSRDLGRDLAVAIDKHLRELRSGGKQSGSTPAGHTKSE